MKNKKFFSIFIFSIILLGTVSAVEIEVKESVKLGENFIVKVSGTFTNKIQESQIKFYRQDHIPTEMGAIKIIEINSDYYFYLMIPLEKKPDIYKILIEDVKYKSGTKILTSDFSAEFKIENQTAPFSINPPLIVASDEYSVQIQNLLSKSITIDLEKKIKPVESNEEEQENETEESLGFFDILFGRNKKSNETITDENNTSLITGQVISQGPITLKSGEIKTLTFLAPKEGTIEKLELYYEYEAYGALVYNPSKETIIIEESNETKNETNTTLNESNQTIEEINNSNETDETNYTNIEIIENGSIINKTTNQTIGSIYNTCLENNGKFCKDREEICVNNEKVKSKDGYSCCLSECVLVKKTSTGKLIGWIIIGVIALLLGWFFKQKYSRAGPGPINFSSIAAGKR